MCKIATAAGLIANIWSGIFFYEVILALCKIHHVLSYLVNLMELVVISVFFTSFARAFKT